MRTRVIISTLFIALLSACGGTNKNIKNDSPNSSTNANPFQEEHIADFPQSEAGELKNLGFGWVWDGKISQNNESVYLWGTLGVFQYSIESSSLLNNWHIPDFIRDVHFSEEEKSALGLSISGNELYLWNIFKGNLIQEIALESEGLSRAIFSNNGDYIIAGGIDGIIYIIDVENFGVINQYSFVEEQYISEIEISPNDKYVSFRQFNYEGQNSKIFTVDLLSGNLIFLFETESYNYVYDISFSSDGNKLLIAAKNEFFLLNPISGEEINSIIPNKKSDRIIDSAISPIKNEVVIISESGKMYIWDIDTNSEKNVIDLNPHSIEFINYSEDGSLFILKNRDGNTMVWDANNWEIVSTVTDHHARGILGVFSNNGNYIATSAFNDLFLWDTETKNYLGKLVGHTDNITDIWFSSDDKIIYTASIDFTIRIWDVDTLGLVSILGTSEKEGGDRLLNSISENPPFAISRDGSLISYQTEEGSIIIANALTSEIIIQFKHNYDSIGGIDFSPDNRTLITSSGDREENGDFSIKLWEVKSGSLLFQSPQLESFIRHVLFSPNGLNFSAYVAYENISVWNASNYQLEEQLKIDSRYGMTYLQYSPNGKYLGFLTPGKNGAEITLYDVEDSYNSRSFIPHENSESLIAFSNSENFIVTVGKDGNQIIVWDLLSLEPDKIIDITPSNYRSSSSRSFEGIEITGDDAKIIVSGKSLIDIYDLKTNQLIDSIHTGSSPTNLTHIQSNNSLITTSGGFYSHGRESINIWDLTKITTSLYSHRNNVLGIRTFDADKLLVSIGRYQIFIWDILTNQIIMELDGFTSSLDDFAFSQSTNVLAVSDGSLIELWDLNNYTIIGNVEIEESSITEMVFTNDGSLLITSNSDGEIFIYQVGQSIRSILFASLDHNIYDIELSPNNELLFVTSRNPEANGSIYNFSTKELVGTFDGGYTIINDISISSDGIYLIGMGERILIWEYDDLLTE